MSWIMALCGKFCPTKERQRSDSFVISTTAVHVYTEPWIVGPISRALCRRVVRLEVESCFMHWLSSCVGPVVGRQQTLNINFTPIASLFCLLLLMPISTIQMFLITNKLVHLALKMDLFYPTTNHIFTFFSTIGEKIRTQIFRLR